VQDKDAMEDEHIICSYLACRIAPLPMTLKVTVRPFAVSNISSSLQIWYDLVRIIRLTLRQSQFNKQISNVHPWIRLYICPSTKSFFDFNKIWRVGRGRWVMHDYMQYELIQGQGQGHEPFKVENSAIFKSYLLRHLQRELNWPQILKPGHNI